MMTKFLANFAASRMSQWAAAFAVAGLSMGLLGAVRYEPVATHRSTVAVDISKMDAGGSEGSELLRDASPASISTSASSARALTTNSVAHKGRTLTMQVTAYCPCKRCCGPSAQGLTASGRSITYNGGRFVAADTRLLPFNTKLIIPGYADEKAVEVVDRGGAIKGNHIDLFFPTHQQAREWGVRMMQVTVVE